MQKALSVDLESYVHRPLNPSRRIYNDNSYTVKATNYLLDLLAKHDTKITFFVLGEIYEWYPELIDRIKDEGHEIGYHGHGHVILKSEKDLIADLKNSKKFINKYRPVGFRAPRMFFRKEYSKILSQYGFKYDSSAYGNKIEKIDGIIELPVSMFNYFSFPEQNYFNGITKEMLLSGFPFGSGLSISVIQKATQFFIDKSKIQNGVVNLFIHPWQLMDYPYPKYLSPAQRILYARKVDRTLEYLLERNKFILLGQISQGLS